MQSNPRKSVGIAILCNLLLTGAGYMYMGRVLLGVGALLFVLFAFVFNPFAGFFTWLALEIVMAIDMLILGGQVRLSGRTIAKSVAALLVLVPVVLVALMLARVAWQDYAQKSGGGRRAAQASLVTARQDEPKPTEASKTGRSPQPAAERPALTRDGVAAIVSTSETFTQMKSRDFVHSLVAVDGIREVSVSEAEALFRWKFVLENPRNEDERTIALTESRAVATLTLYDDGWRLTAIRNAEPTNATESAADLRLALALYERALSRALSPGRQSTGGERTGYAPPRDRAQVEFSSQSDVYGDIATGLYYRGDCERPKSSVRMLATVAKMNGYKPAPACYGPGVLGPETK